MTQTEYENKRRECWEDFLQKHEISGADGVTADAFIMAFDRAYALGREKETVTQEEIEKASVEYADKTAKQYEVCNSEFVQEIMVAFVQGANFALGKQEKNADIVISGWVCRDKEWDKDLFASDLYLSAEKPKRDEYCGAWTNMGAYMPLNTELFPDLTWDSEPEPVEITIKRKKNE